CIACDACREGCPTGAISEGDPIYTIDPNVCNECEGREGGPQCAEVCPVDACVKLEE
ncbi:ferredoxin, partial [candidate division KSB1 bacterium]